MNDIRHIIAAICVIAATALGFYAGRMYERSLTTPEDVTPLPEREQPDGSLILERDPEPAREPPPHAIPKGAVEERRISVHVQPNVSKEPEKTNKPLRIDLSLIREREGRRVIASSPDGKILGGIDIPVTQGMIPVQRKWAAGISHEPFRKLYGGWVERDVGRLRLGAEVQQYEFRDERGVEMWIKAGWTF